jgi:hypothetical protein
MTSMSDPDRLPDDQQYILAHWSAQQVAEDLAIPFDDAVDLLERAYEQDRVQILGTSMFAGIRVDGRWVFVTGRHQLQQAAQEWATLRAMDRQFDE